MKGQEYSKNDGWKDINYELGISEEENKSLNLILNEACHVFFLHADGNWSSYKKKYADQLKKYITIHSSLIKRLLATNDRVIKMITYEAIEQIKHESQDL